MWAIQSPCLGLMCRTTGGTELSNAEEVPGSQKESETEFQPDNVAQMGRSEHCHGGMNSVPEIFIC